MLFQVAWRYLSTSVRWVWRARVDRVQLEKAGLLLRPFCLRRLKEDVEKSLPPRVRLFPAVLR